jgi:hypothetical protein
VYHFLDTSDKLSSLKQAHLRDTGISNHYEADTIIISDDDYSDSSTVVSNSHDSVCTRVERCCEDGGGSDSTVLTCTGEDEAEDM